MQGGSVGDGSLAEGDQSTTSGKCWPISVDIRVTENIGKKLGE